MIKVVLRNFDGLKLQEPERFTDLSHSLPINIGPNFFDIQLFVAPCHELLSIGNVKKINLQVQIDRWSLPKLKDLAIVAKQKFL